MVKNSIHFKSKGFEIINFLKNSVYSTIKKDLNILKIKNKQKNITIFLNYLFLNLKKVD